MKKHKVYLNELSSGQIVLNKYTSIRYWQGYNESSEGMAKSSFFERGTCILIVNVADSIDNFKNISFLIKGEIFHKIMNTNRKISEYFDVA